MWRPRRAVRRWTLFVQRAAAARGEFTLGPGNVAAVGEICRRLDGIPLAIELAAARAGALRPAQIAGLLDERFRLLTRGRAGAAGRQQTLQATLEWSYTLLSETEQRLFDCLGVFPASFDADAAVAVAAAAGLDRWDVLDGLTALVGQSLLAEEEGPDQASRYRLLETMRAYARQHLTAGQLARLHRAHARFYAAFAERVGPEIWGAGQLDWQRPDPGRTGQPAGRRHLGPGPRRPGTPARLPDRDRPSRRCRCFARDHPRLGRSLPHPARRMPARIPRTGPRRRGMERVPRRRFPADATAGRTGPGRTGIRRSAHPPGWYEAVLAVIYWFTGQLERAIGLAREGRQEAAERGIDFHVGFMLAAEAQAWTAAGDYAAARQPAMQAVEIARRVRNPALSAYACCVAAAAIWHSEPQAALLLIEDSLALTRAGADDPVLGKALMLAAVIRARNGDLPGALAALQEATLQHHADGTRALLGLALRVAAGMLARLGEAGPAAVLSGALAAHFPASISASNENERTAAGKTQALARHALGEAAYVAAVGRGAAMDEDEVVRYAVGEFQRVAALLAQPDVPAPHAPPGPATGPATPGCGARP